MKINTKINKQVTESVADCRKILVNAIIELLKSIGAESCQDVTFGRTLFLYQTKNNVSETIIADRISWCEGRGEDDFFITSMGYDMPISNIFMSVSNLQTIYSEVRRVVRAY